MAKTRTYKEPRKLRGEENVRAILQIIYENACRGLSQRAIAVKLGLTHEELITILLADDKRFTMAYEQGAAVFEEENVEVVEAILEDPEASQGLKYKAARENLRTREEWAPASRAVRVEVQNSGSTFTFESLTEEEQEQIKSAHQSADPDGEEDSTQDS